MISLRMDRACLRGKVLGHCRKGMEMVGAKSVVMAIKLVDSCTFFLRKYKFRHAGPFISKTEFLFTDVASSLANKAVLFITKITSSRV